MRLPKLQICTDDRSVNGSAQTVCCLYIERPVQGAVCPEPAFFVVSCLRSVLLPANTAADFFQNVVAGNYKCCQVEAFAKVLNDSWQSNREYGSSSCDSNDDGCFSHIFHLLILSVRLSSLRYLYSIYCIMSRKEMWGKKTLKKLIEG